MTTAVPVGVRLRRLIRNLMIVMWTLALIGPLLLFGQYLINERISERYSPAIDNAHHLLQVMLRSQSDLRLIHEVRDPGTVAGLDQLHERSRELIGAMRDAVDPGTHNAELVDQITVATEAWWADARWIEAEVAAGGAPAITMPAARFTEFADATIEYTEGLEAGRERLRDIGRDIFLGAAAFFVVAMTAATMYGRRREMQETGSIVAPVQALDSVVARQRAGEEVRADEDSGPTEVRNLATELNSLLDQTRAYRDEQEDLTAAQAESLRTLEELDRQKDAFLSTVSHELRTPLTSISGYVEMLSDGEAGRLDSEQLRLVEVIDRNTDRLQGLIEDMLILTRIEAADFVPARDDVDLSQVARDVVEDLVPSATRKEITVVVDAPTPALVEGDPTHLTRALSNLVGNALKFTPASGTVEVAVTTVDGHVVATVRDSGIGIPAAQRAELFSRFFRATNAVSASIPGTGLGLSIVEAIVTEHGGTIEVHSREGRGATFRIDLPAVRPGTGPGSST